MDIKVKKMSIIIILLVLVVLLVSLVMLAKYINSKKYMINLLAKGVNSVNYVSHYDECISYVKGNIEKVVYQNGDITYYDYTKNENIAIDVENKEITLSDINENSGPQISKYKDDFEKNEYKYRGIKEVNGNECFVVDLYDKSEETYLLKRIYIHKKLGVIERINYYTVSNGIEKLTSKTDYNMHTGEVSEQDIIKPDINEYEGYSINDNRK